MKKNIKILFLFFSLFFTMFSVKALDIKEEMIEQIDKNFYMQSIDLTTDGGYVAVNNTNGAGAPVLLKYDKYGKIEWNKELDVYDGISKAIAMPNGDYLVVGSINTPPNEESVFFDKYKGGWCDIIVARYDSKGNIKWQKNYGGNDEENASASIASDGGFFLHGYTYSADFVNNYKGSADAFIIKCDDDGNVIWKIDAGTENSDDIFNGILNIVGNKYAALLRSYADKKNISSIITFDNNGKIISNKQLSSIGYVDHILKANDGGYIILYSDDNNDNFVSKINESGEIIWKNKIANDKNFSFYYPISLTSGYVVSAGSYIPDMPFDDRDEAYSLLIKFNNSGEIEYQKRWTYKEGYSLNRILKLKDNEYIAFGDKVKKVDSTMYKYDPIILKITEPLYIFEKPVDNTNTYIKEEQGDLTFKCDGELELLDKVYINGKELSKEYYTLKKGSTIITIKKEYLNTLNNGDYTLELKYSNGRVAKTSFEVAAKKVETKSEVVKNPNTSDNFVIYATILILSLVGTLKVVHSFKRKCNN